MLVLDPRPAARDYDSVYIYADWTMDLPAVDPNYVPSPELVKLRSYIPGVSFAQLDGPAASRMGAA